MPYITERDTLGVPNRLHWIFPEDMPLCACGAPMAHVNHEDEPECSRCFKKRTGWFFKGHNPDCPWCKGRGCLGCPPVQG